MTRGDAPARQHRAAKLFAGAGNKLGSSSKRLFKKPLLSAPVQKRPRLLNRRRAAKILQEVQTAGATPQQGRRGGGEEERRDVIHHTLRGKGGEKKRRQRDRLSATREVFFFFNLIGCMYFLHSSRLSLRIDSLSPPLLRHFALTSLK